MVMSGTLWHSVVKKTAVIVEVNSGRFNVEGNLISCPFKPIHDFWFQNP